MFHFTDEPLLPREGGEHEHERGQILVLLALALVGLLVAAGLATDAGMLFVRRNQLDRAVDAAALAGVTRLNSSPDAAQALQSANTRGQQLLAANDIITTNAAECLDESDPNYEAFWETHDYCGKQLPGEMFGSIRYQVEARWESEVYFMRLIGFDTLPLRSDAIAEYMPLVDIFSSSAVETGIMQSSNGAIFGPASCTGMGDAYTPDRSPWYDELGGTYTYRIRVPEEYLDEHSALRVELFDPDTANQQQSFYYTYNLAGVRTALTSHEYTCVGNDRREPCLFNKGATTPFWWFVRIDENRYGDLGNNNASSCGTPGSYSANLNTRTQYRLFYLQQNTDGSLSEVDLAYYIGESDGTNSAEAYATDMMWVSPGAPAGERMPAYTVAQVFNNPSHPQAATVLSPAEPATNPETCATCQGDGNFIIQLLDDGTPSETPNIYVDPGSGIRDIYLEVTGLSGSSENGFELWAGPPRSSGTTYEAPSYVNARQLYLQRQYDLEQDVHLSDGVGIYGIGHLPMNSNTTQRVELPLAYLGPEFAGQRMFVDLFDADTSTVPPITFYFDTISPHDWTACFDDSTSWHQGVPKQNDCDQTPSGTVQGQESHYRGPDNLNHSDTWARYEFIVPGELIDGDVADGRLPFYGGRLMVSYTGGNHDTFGWKITIEGRPFLVK